MLSTTAIVSLACLLSTGEVDTNKLTAGLSQQELERVQEVIESGNCLPEKFSALVKKGNTAMTGSPTSDYATSSKSSPTSDY
jgi:hypothetical protein